MTLTAQTLSAAMGGSLPLARYQALLPAFTDCLKQSQCTTVNRAAMLIAQVGHESGGLRYMSELASGSAYNGRRDLGNTQPGDGPRFKGRGPLQITGRSNYGTVSRWAHSNGIVPTTNYFVDHPTELASDRYGFVGVIWYWTVARNMNSYADRGDILGATRAINGGTNGLDDRAARWNRIRKMGPAILPGPALTKVSPIKVGDTARITAKDGAPARTAPGGAFATHNGKPLIQAHGKQFTVKSIRKAKNGQVYASGGQYWYSTARLTGYRKV